MSAIDLVSAILVTLAIIGALAFSTKDNVP
jgi:hypothetical protein